MRTAAGRVRPLVVPVPYGTRARLAVESETARRGWAPARSPAAANLLVVCGTPGEELAGAVERVLAQVPFPRAVVRLTPDATPAEIAGALDDAVNRLADRDSQWRDALRASSLEHEPGQDHSGHDGPREEHAGHDEGHAQHMEHGGGDAHDMHAHHMGEPGGLAMAGRGADRDGLTLDRLHVPLGPILADWPAGLIVEAVLQGDVIQEAAVRVAGGAGGESFWAEPRLAARRGHNVTRGDAERRELARNLDGLGRFLAVAGWPAAAVRARALRDRTLAGASKAALEPGLHRLLRRVGRSTVLRWMLYDIGTPADGPPPAGAVDLQDVPASLRARLDRARAALDALEDDSPFEGDASPVRAGAMLDALPGMLAGTELAAARLIVAALDPDVEDVMAGHHG